MMFLRMYEEGKPETIKSTTSLDTKQMTEYIDQCRMWAAGEGLYIPSPDEYMEGTA